MVFTPIRQGREARIGNDSPRSTGITSYLKNIGTLEKAAAMANHASTRTTQLYDRRSDGSMTDFRYTAFSGFRLKLTA
jgi:hypothetical protein